MPVFRRRGREDPRVGMPITGANQMTVSSRNTKKAAPRRLARLSVMVAAYLEIALRLRRAACVTVPTLALRIAAAGQITPRRARSSTNTSDGDADGNRLRRR